MAKPVNGTRSGLVAALDIGSTKVCCFIARTDGTHRPRVIGIGHQLSEGVHAGAIADMDAVETSILAAVHAAEQMAGETIRQVVVNVSGGRPASRTTRTEIAIAGHAIADADLRTALAQNPGPPDSDSREIIHSVPVAFTIDDARGVRDPRGMFGERLGVEVHQVTAATGALRNLTTCIARCHLTAEAHVVSPYASGLSCLDADERKLGATVVDMGGGTTDIAVFIDGHIAFSSCLAVGGQQVTNDIARGLSTPIAHAERMKTLYGSAVASVSDEREVIDVPRIGESGLDHANHVPRSLLIGIIRPRLEEILEMVRDKLEDAGFDRLAGRRVILTGGASQLQGAVDLAALILDKQVRVGRPVSVSGLAEATGGPAFSTAAGLLTYGVENPSGVADGLFAPAAKDDEPAPRGVFGKASQWLRQNF